MIHSPTLADVDGALRAPICARPEDSVELAVSRLRAGDFDALPVIDEEGRAVAIISWRSIVEAGRPLTVEEASGPVTWLSPDTPLLDSLGAIEREPAVVIQEETGPVRGLVAAADVVIAFGRLAGPFLTLGEIEIRMRAELRRHVREVDLDRAVAHVPGGTLEGTSLGDVIGLWRYFRIAERLGQEDLYDRFEDARRVRNAVMHFHRVGPSEDALDRLHETLNRLRE